MLRDSKEQYIFNMAKAIYKTGHKFYNSSEKKTITKEVDFLEEKYLIETKYTFSNWKMLNKQEKIGKYNCYLAERDFEYQTRKGKTKIKQLVWYTPEIPLPFGPSEFVGFPGLVLKVQSGTIIYKAKVIKLNPKEKIKLDVFKGGKIISEKEFSQITKKAREYLIKG
ncbi:GLPGLI family protein [Tenacibaculum finnmarkense]|nr:GLPGLI family protein [Tenacibaculum finnmarkense]MCD8408713.1 GLPGLI family protein [Tenacibaculum finnmarkense genomovar ulcerans]